MASGNVRQMRTTQILRCTKFTSALGQVPPDAECENGVAAGPALGPAGLSGSTSAQDAAHNDV